jgi:hypothetical protein
MIVDEEEYGVLDDSMIICQYYTGVEAEPTRIYIKRGEVFDGKGRSFPKVTDIFIEQEGSIVNCHFQGEVLVHHFTIEHREEMMKAFRSHHFLRSAPVKEEKR